MCAEEMLWARLPTAVSHVSAAPPAPLLLWMAAVAQVQATKTAATALVCNRDVTAVVVLLSGATFKSAKALLLVMRMAAVVHTFLKQMAAVVAKALMSTVAWGQRQWWKDSARRLRRAGGDRCERC